MERSSIFALEPCLSDNFDETGIYSEQMAHLKKNLSCRYVKTEPNMVLDLCAEWKCHDDYLGCRWISYGRAALKPKASLGAKPQPFGVMVRP